MRFRVTELHPLYAAEIGGADLRRDTDAASVEEIRAAMGRYAVCVVRHATPLTDAEHIGFSALLGPIERRPVLEVQGADKLRVPHHEIIDQSNLDENGAIFDDGDRRLAFKRANRLWHTDMSFHPNRATFSLLSGHVVPPSGAETEFTDMRAAYDALPAATKAKIEGLVAEHSYWHSRVLGGGPEPTEDERRSRPPAYHPMVHIHPGSGRRALYIASHAARILGWPIVEGRALLVELMACATQPQFIYRHRWRVGDVLIWDNLCTMHRATPFDDRLIRRDVRRTTCREREPEIEAMS